MLCAEPSSQICNSRRKLQLLRSTVIALAIIAFVYFEIHSCSKDEIVSPEEPRVIADNSVCAAKDVFFLDFDRGFVAGILGTMTMTEDGGRNWKGITLQAGNLNDIHFLDIDHGWVVGKDGAIFSTEDGGATWTNCEPPGADASEDYFEVRFFGSKKGYILGYRGLYITEDGGRSWENFWFPLANDRGALDASFIDENTGYLLGSRYLQSDPVLLYKTTDGGHRWDPVSGSRASVLRGVMTICFVDASTGWAGGAAIYKTEDGGNSWILERSPATVREFFFIDPSLGIAVGGMTILRTRDAGETWEDITPPLEETVDLRSAYFLDALSGWVVGRAEDEKVGDRIYKRSLLFSTKDGGDSWQMRTFKFDYTRYAELESTEAR